MLVRTRTSSYNPTNAIAYAETYYDTGNYNPAYPDWSSYGGDCANFVSQRLYAGGKSMKGTPGTSTAAENWSNWFSYRRRISIILLLDSLSIICSK